MAKRKRGEAKQATLAQAFAKADAANHNVSPLTTKHHVAEVTKLAQGIQKKFEEYLSQDDVIPEVAEDAGVRRSARDKVVNSKYGEDFQVDSLAAARLSLEPEKHSETIDRTSQRQKALVMLEMMEHAVKPGVILPRELQEAALCVMHDTEFHRSTSISLHANRLMQKHLRLHPPCYLQPIPDGPPLLAVNEASWSPIHGLRIKERQNEDGSTARDVEKLFTLLLHLCTTALEAAELAPPDRTSVLELDAPIFPDPELDAHLLGPLLLLQWVAALLQADLAARLAAHAEHCRIAGQADASSTGAPRYNQLLAESLLNRILESEPGWNGQRSKGALVQTLIRTILLASAPPSAPLLPRFVPLAELGSTAAALLAAVMELLSALEAAGQYARCGVQRTGSSKNDRAELDKVLLEALAPSTRMMPQLEPPSAKLQLLLRLPALEAVRVVGLVLALERDKMYARAEDEVAAPELGAAAVYLQDGGKQQVGWRQVGLLQQLQFVGDRHRLDLLLKGLRGSLGDMVALLAALGLSGAAAAAAASGAAWPQQYGCLGSGDAALVKQEWAEVKAALDGQVVGCSEAQVDSDVLQGWVMAGALVQAL